MEDENKQKVEEDTAQLFKQKKELQQKVIELETAYTNSGDLQAIEQLHEHVRQLITQVIESTKLFLPTINSLKEKYSEKINQEENGNSSQEVDPMDREKLEAEVKVLFSIILQH